MTSYTDVFGGGNISPAQLSYRAITLTADVTLVWPTFAQAGSDLVADKLDVTPSTTGLNITMPDATQVSVGTDVFFRNLGSDAFNVLKADGSALLTVASGEAWFIYVRTNSVAAGTWGTIQMGTGTSTADAASLDGLGLAAAAGLLNQTHPVATKNANYTLLANDRAQTIVSTGGAITFAFTAAATLGDNWFTLIRNSGTGTLTLNPDGSELIDAATTKALAAGESCFVVTDGSAFYTVGYGRSIASTITAIGISGGGGAATQTLSAAEIAAQVQDYSGTLTGDRNYEYGTAAGYWYIYNGMTLGGNVAKWRVNAADTGVTSAVIAAGAHGIIVSNGTNMFLAMAAGSGTVTSVATGTGLSGGTITTTGTITMANTAVTPGSYTTADITVDAQGRLTAASSGTGATVADNTVMGNFSGGVSAPSAQATTGTGSVVRATSPTITTPVINSAAHVGGTWVADATWTLPALTLGGTVSGGGQQLNNIIIGTVTPLAGAFTTISSTGAYTNTVADGTTPMVITSGTTVSNLKSEAAAAIPQNSKSAAYTTVLADAGKHIYHPGADTTARIWTIDSNANVAYPVGTTLTFVNDTSAGVITIAITSDTLVWANTGATGSRTLAASSVATAVKMTTTRWLISGTIGLT